MEADPVRLVVKNTFLTLDSKPAKISTRRRCSDTTNDASGLFADLHELLQEAPPGVFHPPGDLLKRDEAHESEPFSPMRISVTGGKSVCSRRTTDSEDNEAPRAAGKDDKLPKAPSAGIPPGRTADVDDADHVAPKAHRRGLTNRPRRPSKLAADKDCGDAAVASKHFDTRKASVDTAYSPQLVSGCGRHGTDEEPLYDYAYPSTMPPAMPAAMPFAMSHGLPGMQQAYMPMGPAMQPNEMFMPVPGPWGYPSPMHAAWPSGYHPQSSCASSTVPPAKQYFQTAETPSSQKGSGGRLAKATKDSDNSQWRDLQPEEFTTVMLRNLPGSYTRNSLQSLLDRKGFQGLYNFMYMPMNFRSKASFGYAFVNFVNNATAKCAHELFQDFNDWDVPSDKVCDVSWSNMHQGLEAHLDRYRNSPVMHQSVADEYKPALFSPSGERATFPPPTKKLRMPRIRRPNIGEQGEGDNADDDEYDV